jgi:hypothetical protein
MTARHKSPRQNCSTVTARRGEQLSRASKAETVDSAADPGGAPNVGRRIEGAFAVYPSVTFPRGSAK